MGKSTNYTPNYRGRQNYPLNHKTGYSSPPTMQNRRITPLDPIRGGFGLRGVHMAVQSAFYLLKKYETHMSFSLSLLSLLSLSHTLSLSSRQWQRQRAQRRQRAWGGEVRWRRRQRARRRGSGRGSERGRQARRRGKRRGRAAQASGGGHPSSSLPLGYSRLLRLTRLYISPWLVASRSSSSA